MNRRGVSPVIATVLLLVLTVIIAGAVFSFVLPFVKNSLSGSKACMDIFEGVEFAESKFNCFETGPDQTGFSVKISKEKISGVKVALTDENGNSDVFELKKDMTTLPAGLNLLGAGTYYPPVGGQRTYYVDGKYTKGEISAMGEGGETCDVADVVEFLLCDSSVNF